MKKDLAFYHLNHVTYSNIFWILFSIVNWHQINFIYYNSWLNKLKITSRLFYFIWIWSCSKLFREFVWWLWTISFYILCIILSWAWNWDFHFLRIIPLRMTKFSGRLMFIDKVYFRFISQRIRNFDFRLLL